MADFSGFFRKLKKGQFGNKPKARALAKKKYGGQDQSPEAKAARQKSREAKRKSGKW